MQMTTKHSRQTSGRKALSCFISFAFVLSIFSSYAHAWAGGEILAPFPQYAGNDKRQEAAAMAVDLSGNVIVTGYQNLAGDTNDNFYTAKFKADGTGLAWASKVLDYAGGADRATAVAVDSSGDILVSGIVTVGGKRDILTIKYSGSTGAELWRAIYNGAANGDDIPVAIAVDDRDNVYVAGYTQNSAANDDYLVLKYTKTGANQDGSPVWAMLYDGTGLGTDRITGLAVGAGSVVVTGHSKSPCTTLNVTNFDIATIKYAETGDLIWLQRTSSPGDLQPDWGKSVFIDGAGDVAMTGFKTSLLGQDIQADIYTVKYRDPLSGTAPILVWESTYSSSFDDVPAAIIAVDSSLFVLGTTMTLTGNRDMVLIKYRDPVSGQAPVIDWTRIINSSGSDIDEAVSMTADRAGNLYLTGTQAATVVNTQAAKVRQSDGVILWQHNYENLSGTNNRPVGIGVSASDDVYVAGSIERSGAFDLDFYVFRYDPGFINAPSDLTVTGLAKQGNGSYAVTLNWLDHADNEDNYIVERRVGNGVFQPLITLGANSTSHIDTNLTEWTHYTYRVKARNTVNGDSHYSNELPVLALVVTELQPVWTYLYNGRFDSDDFATAIAIGPDNNPVITGHSLDYAPGYSSGSYSTDYLTIKLDRNSAGPSAGTGQGVLWLEQFEGGNYQEDDAKGVAVDSNNRVIVTGNSIQYAGGSDNVNSIVTLKYLADGADTLWQAQYNGPVAIDDRVKAIAANTDGSDSVVVIGHGRKIVTENANEDMYVIKYAAAPAKDAQGKAIPEWVALPVDVNHGDDYPSAVTFDQEGNVFIAGYAETGFGTGTYQAYAAKYCGKANSASCGVGVIAGQQIWSHIRTDLTGSNQARSLTIDTNGDLYVAGFVTTSDSNRDFLVAKYDGKNTPIGSRQIWSKTYRSPQYLLGDDEAVAIKYDAIDDRVVVAGNSDVANGDSDITIVSYDATNGNVYWVKSVPSAGYDELASDMVLDLSGNIYVVGASTGGPLLDTDSLAVKFDYDGNLLGRTVYNQATKIDQATTAAVNKLGDLFVAGYSTNTHTGVNGSNADYLVYKVAGVALQAPIPFTVVQNYRSAILSWVDNATTESGFDLERKSGACPTDVRVNDPLNPWVPVVGSPFAANTLNYTDLSLADGGVYCYRLRAVAANGEVTRWVPRSTIMNEPPPPTNFVASPVDTTAIQLAWGDATTNEQGFFIERCEGASCTFAATEPGYFPITAAANSSAYLDTTVCAGTIYRYRIQAFRNNEWRTAFTTLGGDVSARPVAAPTGVLATSLNEAQIRLNWSSQTADADGYKIWRCLDGGGGCTDFGASPVATVINGTASFIDNTFTQNATFRYKVSAFKQTPTCTWASDQSVATAGATTASTDLTLSASGITASQATLSWTNPTATETGFRLERCDMASCAVDTDFTRFLVTAPNVTTYADSGICSGKTYGYRVQAVNDGLTLNGNGAWSWRLPLTLTGFQPGKLVRLELNRQAGMKTDYADIRFYDDLGKIELPYWIETFTGQPTSVVVWIKLGENQSVTLYYGNALAVSASNAAAVFGAAPVGYWPFRETAGTLAGTTADISGNALHANLSGMVSSYGIVAGGKYGNALNMASGAAAYVSDTANSLLDITGSLTVELWYQYQKSGEWARIITKGASSGQAPWDVMNIELDNDPVNQRLHFRIASSNSSPYAEIVSPWSPQLVPGTWYHLVGRYNASTGRASLFVNGVEYATVGTPIVIAVNNEPFAIGKIGGSALGRYDEVRLFNTALTDQDIAARYATTLPEVTVVQAPVAGPFILEGWTGNFSSPQPVLIVSPLTLPTPTGVTASWVSESQLKVDWVYPNGEQSGFEVDRCLGVSCVRVKDATATERSFTDGGLLHNTSYHYLVRAVKAATCRAVSADAVSLTQETTLKAPEMAPVPLVDIGTVCADYRLFENDGVTPVPFFVEQCNSAKTTLWVKYSSLASGLRSLKLYYGNFLAPTVAVNSASIFPFYDGFDGTSIDTNLWTINDATGWSVGNGQLRGTNSSGRLTSKSTFNAGYIQEVKAKTTTRAANGQQMAGFFLGFYDSIGFLDHPGSLVYRNNGGWGNFPSELPLAINMLYQLQVKNSSTVRLSVYNLDTQALAADFGDLTNYVTNEPIVLGRRYDDYAATLNQPYVADWDWVRIRRYLDLSLVPTVTIGAEVRNPPEMAGWLTGRSVTINNPGPALSYTSPDGYQIGIVVGDSTPLATDQITLTWKDVTATEENLVVERCLGTAASCTVGQFAVNKSVTLNPAAGVGANISFVDRDLAKDTSYCYRVRATRSSTWLTSPDSAIVCGKTVPVPAAPQLQTATGQETRIDLAWTAMDTVGENGFEIERCSIVSPALDCDLDTQRDPGFPKYALPNATAFADDGVCGTYKYRVRSYKLGATVWPGWSNEKTASTVLPVAPINVTASAVNDVKATVSWTDKTGDESGFEVWRCASTETCTSANSTQIWAGSSAGIGSVVTLSDTTGLSPGSYHYQVRAVKTGGSCGWPSQFSALSGSLVINASAPTGVSASADNTTQATVRWADTTFSETGFALHRCKDPALMSPCTDFQPVGTANGVNVTSYSDNQVCAASTYRYKVGAVNTGIQFTQPGGGCWTSRMQLQIGGFQPNFISRVTVPRSPAMKGDYSDLRLFDTTTGTEIPFWIEQFDAAGATLWLKTGVNNSIFLYFGNPSATAVSSVSAVFGAGLKAYWPFNEASGTISGNLADVSGNNNNVNMANFAAPHGIVSSGKYGNALSLDGVNDLATKSVPVVPTGSVMSVEAWVYPKAYGYDYNSFVSWGTRGCDGYGFGASVGTNGKPQIATWCNDYSSSGSALTLNAWNHVVYVMNGAAVDMYVNGVKSSGTLSKNKVPSLSSVNLTIGSLDAAAGSRHFNGLVDDLRIYNQALTSADVAARYATISPTFSFGALETAVVCQNTFTGSLSTLATAITPMVGNLLDDPDFERAFNTGLTWGSQAGIDNYYVTLDPTISYSGSNSMKIEPNGLLQGRGQTVAVVPNETYQLSGYLKSNLTGGGARAQCDVYGTGIDSAGIAISTLGPVDWTFKQETVVIPSGTTTVSVRCFVNGSYPLGTAWFDMVQFVPQQLVKLTASRVSEGAIRLDWTDAFKDESGFKVSRCAWSVGDTTCTNFLQLGSTLAVDQIGMTDTNVEPDRKYTYRVEVFKATTCAWPQTFSNEVTVTASLNPPGKPVVVALDTTRAKVDWSSSFTTETGFNILRSTSTDSGLIWSAYSMLAAKTSAGTTSLVDDTVCPGTQVRYKVQAYKDGLTQSGGNCWTRSKQITVANYQPAIQMRLVVGYDTDMKTDYSDLRFYDQDAAAELPYWIEKSDATSATVWIKTGSSSTLLMYYGNPTATSMSNPQRVFDLFDSFDGATVNSTRWQEVDTAANYVTQNEELIFAIGAPDGAAGIYSQANFARPFIFEVQGITGNDGGDVALGFKNTSTAISRNQFVHALDVYYYETAEMRVLDADPVAAVGYGGILSRNTKYQFRIDVKPVGAKYSFGVDNGTMSTFATGTTGKTSPLKASFSTRNRDMRIDNVRLRRYSVVELTASFGSEVVLASCPTFTGQWVSPESLPSDAISLPVPVAPILTAVSSKNDVDIELVWTPKTTDQSGFSILRCEAPYNGSCTPTDVGLTVSAGASSFIDSGRTPSTTYCYQVAAYKSAPCTSKWETAVSSIACDLTMSGRVSDLTVTPITSRAVRLTWKANADVVNDEEGFEIETLISHAINADITSNAAIWASIATVQKKINSDDYLYDHMQGLEPNRTYWYRVRPYRGADKSPYTVPAPVTTFKAAEKPAVDVCPP